MQNSTQAHIYKALTATQIIANLAQLEGWHLHGDGADVVIQKTFKFSSYAHTLLFANHVAWLAQVNHHHPVLQIHVDHCVVQFQTHDVGGLSQADFHNAVAVDALPLVSIKPAT